MGTIRPDNVLGSGAFGTVYHAVVGEPPAVAVKVITAAQAAAHGATLHEELPRATAVATKVRHPNLLELKGVVRPSTALSSRPQCKCCS